MSGIQESSTPFSGNRGPRRTLEPKGVSRVETFGGKESQWREWAFTFRVAIKAMDSEVAQMMAKTEASEDARKIEDLEL